MKKILILFLMMHLQANQLQKVYIHSVPQAGQLQETPHIELEKMVFYFDEKPTVHSIVHNDQKHTGWKHETYFFTVNGMQDSCKKKLNNMQQNTKHYRIACKEVDQPRKGLRVELCYDPNNIACACDTFDAITQHKGVVVRLINKSFLNQIGNIEKPLLQLACNQKRKVVIDCGHGGCDPGAIGMYNIAEKDVTLKVGTILADLLKKKAFLLL